MILCGRLGAGLEILIMKWMEGDVSEFLKRHSSSPIIETDLKLIKDTGASQHIENRSQTRMEKIGVRPENHQKRDGRVSHRLGVHSLYRECMAGCGGVYIPSPIQAYFGIDLRQKQVTVNRG
jgi:hypothetical protein